MKNTNNNLTEEQIKELLRAQGRKLGFLIGSANIKDEEKAALIEMVPEMSLEQIERLIKILEAKYIDEKTKDVDEEFKKNLEEIRDKYNQKREKLNKDILAKLEKLAKKIK